MGVIAYVEQALQSTNIVIIALSLLAGYFGRMLGVITRKLEAVSKKIDDQKPQGYHVTYLVIKDHDTNNALARVPNQERIRTGIEFNIRSRFIDHKDAVGFVPEDVRIYLAQSSPDYDEISNIEFVGVIPQNPREHAANVAAIKRIRGVP